jgi:hypothetical protein
MTDVPVTSMTAIKVTLTEADSREGSEIVLSEHLVPTASNTRRINRLDHHHLPTDDPFLALPNDRRPSWGNTILSTIFIWLAFSTKHLLKTTTHAIDSQLTVCRGP